MAVYPDIYPEHIGRSMPEALGYCVLTTGECEDTTRGAIEAVYVDTSGAPFSYLASRGSLHSVTEVFSDGVLMATPGDYTIAYRDGGRTYIDFVADQGDKKITFNCNGYMFAPWNSTNGYVQNPIYIILFCLAFIVGVPEANIDVASFDALATKYENKGYEEVGKLIIQDVRETEAVLQELLFSIGAKLWAANNGKLKIGVKDIDDFVTSTVIFSQIDVIGDVKRKYNLDTAVNSIKAKYDFAPTANIYKGAKEDTNESSVEDYGDVKMESQTPYFFPWITSDELTAKRLTDDLLKMGHGDKIIEFQVSINWIDDLDIFTNIRVQDPYGLSWTKSGEQGHYYYIIGLETDFQSQIISVTAVDLQWLLRQYCIMAKCSDLTSLDWATASEADRMYAYMCDCTTGKFSDGEPCKKMAKCT